MGTGAYRHERQHKGKPMQASTMVDLRLSKPSNSVVPGEAAHI